MERAVICQGGPTSHGGKVLEGASHATVDGRPISLRGHQTFCPQCKGTFPIVEGLDFHTFAGLGTAVDGMKTACGAKLIATQQQMFIDDGAGGDESDAPFNSTAKPSTQYHGSFRAIDKDTGKPVEGRPYRIVLADGRTLRGVTDVDGNTQQVSSPDLSSVQLHWESEHCDDDQGAR